MTNSSTDSNYDDFCDLSIVGGQGEEIPGGVLAADTGGFRVTPPGEYTSQSRTIKGRRITKGENAGHMEYEISFESGLLDASGKFVQTKFLKKKVTTIPFTLKDAEGNPILNPATGQPKQGSSVAAYLQSFGYETANLNLQQLQEMLTESQMKPVKVVIGWADKAVKDETTGQWTNGNLKTKDFQTGGTKEAPVYSETVKVEGVLYNAKAVVSYFRKAA